MGQRHDNLAAAPEQLAYATPAAARGVAVSAIVCFVSGLMSLAMYLVAEILPLRKWRWLEPAAVILLIVALVSAKLAFPRTRAAAGRRLAAGGLLLGFVCLGTVVLFPLPHPHSPERYRVVQCESHLRQIEHATLIYAMDHGGRFPDTMPELLEHLPPSIFVCPSTTDTPATGPTTQAVAANLVAGGHLSYIYLGKGMTDKTSPNAILAYEPLANHKASMHVVYVDGGVGSVHPSLAQKWLAELNAGHNPPRAEKLK